MQQMQKNMEEMQKKIAELEKEKTAAASAIAPVRAPTSPPSKTLEKVAAGEDIGTASLVVHRPALNDQQEGAQRPKDYTLDPEVPGLLSHSQHARADQIQRQAAGGHHLGHTQLGQSRIASSRLKSPSRASPITAAANGSM